LACAVTPLTPRLVRPAQNQATPRVVILKSSDKGLWDRGDSAAKKYAIGSSVYQECYEGQWVSYALSARASKVTDYQFRADGEWYAEAYAAFFVGKLPASHPLHPVLTQDKQSTAAAQRAAR